MRHIGILSMVIVLATGIFTACSLPTSMPGSNLPAMDIAPAATAANEVTDRAIGDVSTESKGGSVPRTTSEIIRDGGSAPFDTHEWRTDFSIRSVVWSEILSGGPAKDGIPAIDAPEFERVETASEWLTERDPVILFQHEGVARAYPLSILIWHEIVNDEVAGLPVAVTFCPLCNASIVFDRHFDGKVLDFGTTGKLRNSDLVMYDRQTETWWQQFTGEAIVGEYTGRQLRFLSSQVIAFGDFAEEHPAGEVLARPTRNGQIMRRYGQNPYVSYDSNERPFLFDGKVDGRLSAVERVVGLTTERAARAYPFSVVAEQQVIHDEFEGISLVIFHKPGKASALDSGVISSGRDIGTAGVFDRRVDDWTLTFTVGDAGNFVDEETGTTWNILGQGTQGPLSGRHLQQILHFDHFWFAWAAFFPDTEVYNIEDFQFSIDERYPDRKSKGCSNRLM